MVTRMFKDLTIGSRLSLGFGLVFVLFCMLTIFAINRMEYLANNTSLIYNHPLTVSKAVLRINAHIIKMHRSMKDVALDDSLDEILRDSQLVDGFEIEVYADFDIIEKLFLGDKTLFETARQVFVSWKPIRDEVIELMLAGKRTKAERITKGKGAQHVVKIENAMDALNIFAQSKATKFLSNAESTTTQSITTIYLLLLITVIGMMMFTIYLTRSITRPVEALRAAVKEIGEGKLDTTLDIEASGEMGELAISIREMTANLSKVTASRDRLNKEIIKRKQIEKERQKLMNNLEEQNAEMERFVYTVSHDLKSPLITIQGFLGLLKKDAAENEQERLYSDIDQIQKATVQMQELLADLLEISRIGRLVNPPEKVTFNELIQDAIEILAGQINECGARIDVAPDLPTLFGDRKRLLEVVQNLIDNALKFMGEQADPHIEIGSRREKDGDICYIRDNGIGIKPRYHKKIFKLFERLTPAVEGTGIGLAIVKRIIDLEGGRIWVESEGEGMGCTFCFVLSKEVYRNMNIKNIQDEPAVILLVEDNPAHAELIMRGLEDSRVANRVMHVSDGEEALDYLFRRGDYADPETSPQPHLILLDLRLPRVDGLEVLKETRESSLDGMPVAILTSSEADADMAKAYEYHASSYLVKPLDFNQFKTMMDDLGFYWLCWNRYPWKTK